MSHPSIKEAIVSLHDNGYPLKRAITYSDAVSKNANSEPMRIAFGRATVLPTASLILSTVGWCMILLNLRPAGDS